MENNKIITDEQLNAFASQVASRVAINTKDVLTSDEAAVYLGVSKSFLYKLTMRKEIPHYKPNGKLCFFERGTKPMGRAGQVCHYYRATG